MRILRYRVLYNEENAFNKRGNQRCWMEISEDLNPPVWLEIYGREVFLIDEKLLSVQDLILSSKYSDSLPRYMEKYLKPIIYHSSVCLGIYSYYLYGLKLVVLDDWTKELRNGLLVWKIFFYC